MLFQRLPEHRAEAERDRTFEAFLRDSLDEISPLSFAFVGTSFRLELSPRLEELTSLRSVLCWCLQEWEIEDDVTSELVLAFEEAVANILRHSYQPSREGWIRFELTLESDRLVLAFQDRGEGGRREELAEALSRTSREGRPTLRRRGGLGLYLLKRLMTEAKYEPGGAVNRLTLVKSLAPPASEAD